MSVIMGTATLKRSAATESGSLCRLMAGNDNPTVNMANACRGRAYVREIARRIALEPPEYDQLYNPWVSLR